MSSSDSSSANLKRARRVTPLRNLPLYRAASSLFTYGPLPKNNLLQAIGVSDAVADAISPAVAGGISVLLTPLTPGMHTLHFGGQFVFTQDPDGFNFRFTLDITYHLTVTSQ